MAKSAVGNRQRNSTRRRNKIASEQNPVSTEERAATIHGECGAKKSNGRKCRQAKGWGTEHLGVGRCKFHGGSTPAHNVSALRSKAVLMGAPKEINPVDALYWCIKITAGEVEWLSDRIAELDEKDWIESSIMGKQMNLLARERTAAVVRLANFSKMAMGLGLAERSVRLAENYGIALSRLLRGVLEDLQLTEFQKNLAPQVIRKHLVLLEGHNPVTPEDRKAIPAIIEGDAA